MDVTHILRRLALALIAAYALFPAAPAHADGFSHISIRLGARTLRLDHPAVRTPDEVYAPLSLLDALGVRHRETAHEESVIVVDASGAEREIGLARPGKRAMIPLSSLAVTLGYTLRVSAGSCDLIRPGDAPTEAQARASAPNPPTAGVPMRPARTPDPQPAATSADRSGARPSPPASSGASARHAATPLHPSDARSQPPPSAAPIQRADPVDSTGPAIIPAASVRTVSDTILPVTRKPEPPLPGVDRSLLPPEGPARLQLIDFVAPDPAHAQVRLYFSGPVNPSVSYAANPSRLVIAVPDASLGDLPPCHVEHPLARSVSAAPGPSPGSLQVTVTLGRLVAYSLTQTGPGVYSLNLRLPRGAGIRPEDAVIVIDPGHGGKQTGCQFQAGDTRIEEKSLTLAIAKRVQAELRSLGITHTYLTRSDDSLVDLYERTRIAAALNADLFVSIHVDEWARSTAACGPTAYFHRADESSRALAQSLIGHVGAASVSPSRGALSDGVLYANGLAVLRSATMPATLVECGFLTNPADRRALLSSEYQARIAQAIAEGIRGYLSASLPDQPAAAPSTE